MQSVRLQALSGRLLKEIPSALPQISGEQNDVNVRSLLQTIHQRDSHSSPRRPRKHVRRLQQDGNGRDNPMCDSQRPRLGTFMALVLFDNQSDPKRRISEHLLQI